MNSRQLTASVIQSKHTISTTGFLTKYLEPTDTIFNLLNSDRPNESNKQNSKRPVTHWKSRIVMNGQIKPFSFYKSHLPFEMLHLIQLDSKKRYMPLFHISDVRQRLIDVKPLPKQKPPIKMSLEIVYEPLSIGKIRLTIMFEKVFLMMKKFGFGENEIEDAKGIFFETSGHFLLLTILIISFHVNSIE